MGKNSSSIFQIWWKTRKDLKNQDDSINVFIPIWVGQIILNLDLYFDLTNKESVQKIIEILLSLDSGLLGFSIAGFGIFQAIPRSILNISLANKVSNTRHSFYKFFLLNYLHVLVIIFSCICILLTFYLMSYFPGYLFDPMYVKIMKSLLVAGVAFVQTVIFVQLKIFIFWFYDNALMLAQASAKKNHDAAITYDEKMNNPLPLEESND